MNTLRFLWLCGCEKKGIINKTVCLKKTDETEPANITHQSKKKGKSPYAHQSTMVRKDRSSDELCI